MFRLKRGDTAPPLQATLTDNGVPIDLTPATGIQVIGSRGGTQAFTRTVTGTDQGLVLMPWQSGDTAIPGLLNIEIQVSYPDGSTQTYPPSGYLTVLIDRDLG